MEPSYCYIGIEIPCFYRFYSIFNFGCAVSAIQGNKFNGLFH